jgi:hypothetical protein
LYFYDTGLAAYLLGIRKETDINVHFAKGALFENLVINELLKDGLNRGERLQHYFWRDTSQHEVDLIIDKGLERDIYEIKVSQTINPDFFKTLNYYKHLDQTANLNLIYGGTTDQERNGIKIYGFENNNYLAGAK